MENFNPLCEINILLPTRTPSSGATVNKTEYVIVDGIAPYVYFFTFDGTFKGAVPTLRPYRKIVYSMETDSYFATDANCSPFVYFLNCRFEETDKVQIECASTLLDISLSQGNCSDESFILTSPHKVGAFSKNGGFLYNIKTENKNVFYNSFVKSGSNSAEGFTKGCTELISFNIGCNFLKVSLPQCTILKNLFVTDGGGIYGFFGKNYANSIIVPIFENDSLNPAFFMGGNTPQN